MLPRLGRPGVVPCQAALRLEVLVVASRLVTRLVAYLVPCPVPCPGAFVGAGRGVRLRGVLLPVPLPHRVGGRGVMVLHQLLVVVPWVVALLYVRGQQRTQQNENHEMGPSCVPSR